MSRESEADPVGGTQLPGVLPEALFAELVAFRRDVHMHPELGNQEFRTTAAIKARLEKAGLKPRVLAGGTGLVCDIGVEEDAEAEAASTERAPGTTATALTAPGTKPPTPATSTAPGARAPLDAAPPALGVKAPGTATPPVPGAKAPLDAASTAPGVRAPLDAALLAPGVKAPGTATPTAPGVKAPVAAASTAPGVKAPVAAASTAPGVKAPVAAASTAPGVKATLAATSPAPGVSASLDATPPALGVKTPAAATPTAPGVSTSLDAAPPALGVKTPAAATPTAPGVSTSLNAAPPAPGVKATAALSTPGVNAPAPATSTAPGVTASLDAAPPAPGVKAPLNADPATPAVKPPGIFALRADIDALPIPDTKTTSPYRSTVPDRAHACGHDVHTTVVLGAGLVLADLHRRGKLPRPVRLIFQPAEEILPGGASDAIEDGVLDGVGRIIAVHCDPRVDAGKIGLREGAITSACDRLEIALDGPGGHTARPHLTTDLVTAAARVVVDVPALVGRRVDTRAGLAVTWGRIECGHAPNVIPQHAELSGTVRCLDIEAWRQAPDIVVAAIDEVANMHHAKSEINYVRGVPPVVNDPEVTGLLRDAMTARRGTESVEGTEQSLGGEDFSWYLEQVPGAMARLGVRTPGERTVRDLHQGNFDADEHAITVGVELFTAAALLDAATRTS